MVELIQRQTGRSPGCSYLFACSIGTCCREQTLGVWGTYQNS